MPSQQVTNLYPAPNYEQDGSTAITDQALTVDATVGGVQFSAFDESTSYIVFDVQDANVRCTFDGSAPTSSNGHKLYAERAYTWHRLTAEKAKFIRADSTDAVIHASEFLT